MTRRNEQDAVDVHLRRSHNLFWPAEKGSRRSEIDYGRHSELMNPLVMAASTAITLALVFYTIGVFGEARAGSLQKKHLILFWIGLACDTTGTTIMTSIARSSHGAGSPLHAITGALALPRRLGDLRPSPWRREEP